jgi:hypothetical protein
MPKDTVVKVMPTAMPASPLGVGISCFGISFEEENYQRVKVQADQDIDV